MEFLKASLMQCQQVVTGKVDLNLFKVGQHASARALVPACLLAYGRYGCGGR
jgi:hypothetical protein